MRALPEVASKDKRKASGGMGGCGHRLRQPARSSARQVAGWLVLCRAAKIWKGAGCRSGSQQQQAHGRRPRPLPRCMQSWRPVRQCSTAAALHPPCATPRPQVMQRQQGAMRGVPNVVQAGRIAGLKHQLQAMRKKWVGGGGGSGGGGGFAAAVVKAMAVAAAVAGGVSCW